MLYSRGCSDRTRGKDFQLKEGQFRADIRKKFGVYFYNKGIAILKLIA